MNMVSESDLPRPVSGPMQNASADDLQQEVSVRRLGQYLKHAEQLHDSFSRPGSGRTCRSGGEVRVTGEGQHIQGNIFIYSSFASCKYLSFNGLSTIRELSLPS